MSSFDSLLRLKLSRLGYSEVSRGILRAEWGCADVEHYLYVTYSYSDTRVGVDIGIKREPAEKFSIDCIRRFGGKVYQTAKFDYSTSVMRYSIGRIADWSSLLTLMIGFVSDEELTDKIVDDIQGTVLPRLLTIDSIDAFFEVVLSDDQPFRWVYVNGAMRAAQVAFLGRERGYSFDRLRTLLMPREKDISRSLRGVDVVQYLNQVFDNLH